MIRKIWSLVLLGVIAIMIIQIASAQEVSTDEETEQEIGIMDTVKGAHVRLTQLEKSVVRSVAAGEQIVSRINQANTDANVSVLNSIMEELNNLAESIRNTAVDETNSSEMAQEFVALKSEARALAKEFRNLSRSTLNKSVREELRERVKNIDNEELQEIDNRLREEVRKHNALQIQEKLQIMGINRSELVEQVRSGELNTGGAVSALAKEFRGLGQEKQKDAFARVKEEKAKREVNKEIIMEKVQEKIQEIQKRVQERVSKAIPDHAKGKGAQIAGNQKEKDQQSGRDETQGQEISDEDAQGQEAGKGNGGRKK